MAGGRRFEYIILPPNNELEEKKKHDYRFENSRRME